MNGFHLKEIYLCRFFDIENKLNLNKITRINCLILQKSLQKFTDYKVEIKKPNDILIKRKKISGILQETVFKNKKKFLVVGIGVNLIKSPKIKNYPTNFFNFYTKKMLQSYRFLNYCVALMKKN